MKNTLKTKEEVLAVVNSYITHFEYYNWKVPVEYGLYVGVTDELVHWRIRFEWVYAVEHLDLGAHREKISTDSFIWLKGEDFINLFSDIDNMLEKITKDEIEVIPFK